MKKNKNTSFNKLFMLVLGMFFIITAFNVLEIEKDYIEYMETNGEPAEATIVRFSRSVGKKRRIRPVIAYEFEGEEHERTMSRYSFLMGEGDTIEILVDPDNPKSFVESDNNTITLLSALVEEDTDLKHFV